MNIRFSSNALKIVAMISMIIDHVGFVFFPQYLIFRYIGRIAFPIYCFLLVEGFYHTHNVYRYMARLSIFAIISEVPFNLGLYNTLIHRDNTNVFFTLLIGLVVIFLAETVYKKTGDRTSGMLFAIAGMVVANYIKCDYSYMGVLIIYMFYLAREGRRLGTDNSRRNTTLLMCIFFCGIILVNRGTIENYAIFSLAFILLYSGEKSGKLWEKMHLDKINKFMQIFFYAFYPLHLLIIYFVR